MKYAKKAGDASAAGITKENTEAEIQQRVKDALRQHLAWYEGYLNEEVSN